MRTSILLGFVSCTVAVSGILACGAAPLGPAELAGLYHLVSENGRDLPTDPHIPGNCCITLAGRLTLTETTFTFERTVLFRSDLSMATGALNGSYTVEGDEITLVPDDPILAVLFDVGKIAGDVITLRYGDEGPGSNQIEGRFVKAR